MVVRARAFQRQLFELAANIALLCRHLARSPDADIIRCQVIRSATSTAANYRAACRAQTAKVFISKISIAAEEADETLFWLSLLVRLQLIDKRKIVPFAKELDQVVRVLTKSRKTAFKNLKARAGNR